MATEILVKEGTPIVWANGDYGTGNQVGGLQTHSIELKDLLFTAAVQGGQADLFNGGNGMADSHAATVAIEFKTGEAPESGETVNFYWGPSDHFASGSGNPGGLTGASGAYTGTAGDSLADSINQLMFVGAVVLTSDALGVVQRQTFRFSPPSRYGSPVIQNNTDAEDLNNLDGASMYIRVVPLIDEIQ